MILDFVADSDIPMLSLAYDEAGYDFQSQNSYEDAIREQLSINVNKYKHRVIKFGRKGIFKHIHPERLFTINGSLCVSALNELGPAKHFFATNTRYFIKQSGISKQYILRGPNYITALNASLSVPQKLRIYQQDIEDALDCFRNFKEPEFERFEYASPLLDYIKNALITLLNAQIHEEKLGKLRLDDFDYQRSRKWLVEIGSLATFYYYQSLIGQFSKDKFQHLLNRLDKNYINQIIQVLEHDFRKYKFSSRAVVRPEASHPLVLLAFVVNISDDYPDVKFIVGLPSGGTELGCLCHSWLTNDGKNVELFLLPVSVHTTRDQYSFESEVYNSLQPLLPVTFNGGQVLVVDDNSSTGETMNVTMKLLRSVESNVNAKYLVAEADIHRTRLKFKDQNKKHRIAHPCLFHSSVSILPVSRRVRPKYDLKELYEAELLCGSIRDFANTQLADAIMKEVIVDSIRNRWEYIREEVTRKDSIRNFKHEFLSNFYTVRIEYDGHIYPTVEHAYLAQKYKGVDFRSLGKLQRAELNEILKMKGILRTIDNFDGIFRTTDLPAGVMKRFSNKFKLWGYERPDWDQVRLRLMIQLEIKKYSTSDMKKRLVETHPKYLIEGNDWNDTFWGICDGRGHNYLGRILMAVRKHHMSNEALDVSRHIRKS